MTLQYTARMHLRASIAGLLTTLAWGACAAPRAELRAAQSLPSVAPPAPAYVAPIVLRPARVLNVESGEYFPNGTVIVVDHGSVIALVAPEDASSVPEGARVIDLPTLTLLPGLIDAHTHLLHLVDPRIRNESEAMLLETSQLSDADRALRGARHAREMLESGFTTIRDLGNAGDGADFALRDAIAAGHVVGPTMLVSGRAIAGARGQFDRRQWRLHDLIEHEYRVISGVHQAVTATRDTIAAGVNGVKIIVGSETAITLSTEEVTAIVEEAHRAGLWVAAHCTDDAAARIALDAGIDSIEHGYELSDGTLERMAAGGVALVPTDYPVAFYQSVVDVNPFVPDAQRDGFARAVAAQRQASTERLRRAVMAGVPIVAGSDAYFAWGDRTRGQIAAAMFRAYAEAGMTPIDIVRSATTRAAVLLRRADRIGRLAPGMEADIIGVEGHPLRHERWCDRHHRSFALRRRSASDSMTLTLGSAER